VEPTITFVSTIRGVEQEGARAGAWLPMALLLPLLWWTLVKIPGPPPWCFLDYVNLAFHEAGHLFFGFLGQTIRVLGGTIMQLLVPGTLIAYFLLKQRQPLGAAFCLWWLGESLSYVATYMSDARDLALPLVGGGEHDWTWLFYEFGLLTEPAVNAVWKTTHALSLLIMLAGLAWVALLLLPEDLRSRFAGSRLAR